MTATTNASGERIAAPDRAPAELLDVQDVSMLLACSPRHVFRLSDGGRMPRPIRLGALVRWRHSELLAWLDASCPTVRTVRARGAGL